LVQLPQWLLSVLTLTQLPEQFVYPLRQLQDPDEQFAFAWQLMVLPS
jgi:hypothetical protein